MSANDPRPAVVVIDDDPFALKVLSVQLEGARPKGCDCPQLISFDRAQAAIALLEKGQRQVSMIVCDLQMPGMDGIEFVRNLARLGYRGGILLVSGEDSRILRAAERMAKAHKLRVLGALRKPVMQAHLRRALQRTLPEADGELEEPGPEVAPEDLRRAIRAHELVTHYQPKVRMATGEVVGVEVLVRWQHREFGLVMPEWFIPVAEEFGLMDELAEEVIGDALRQSRCWMDLGRQLDVAVNISMSNLGSLDFPDRLARMAGDIGLPLSSLILEVTEAQIMTDPRSQLDILARLKLKGVRLSIDDFGIGYSNLAQLRDLPFDELKIDRGFVHSAGADPSRHAILKASIGLARKFGMKTVGEGVENRVDWHVLRQAGCDLAQGFYIAKPMPGDEFAGWLDHWAGHRQALTAEAGKLQRSPH
jgi:EAL domain-containing protein (putative c-di-GMP-specific phosphodiesterase class I)/CheY-like chemotaxis protein